MSNFTATGKLDSYTILECTNITLSSRSHNCRSMESKRIFRMKIIPKYNIGRFLTRDQLETEIKIIKQVNHENLIKVHEIFDDENNIYIISNLFSSDPLTNLINSQSNIAESRLHHIMNQFINALLYLQANCITIRCLRPENIMIDIHDNICITDFSYSTVASQSDMLDDFYDTSIYCPPEMLAHESYNGYLVDVWCLGIIFYQIINHVAPWNGYDLLAEINSHELPKTSNMSISEYNLLTKMLEKNQTRRHSLIQIQNHFWIQNPKINDKNQTYTLLRTNTFTNNKCSLQKRHSDPLSAVGGNFEHTQKLEIPSISATTKIFSAIESKPRFTPTTLKQRTNSMITKKALPMLNGNATKRKNVDTSPIKRYFMHNPVPLNTLLE